MAFISSSEEDEDSISVSDSSNEFESKNTSATKKQPLKKAQKKSTNSAMDSDSVTKSKMPKKSSGAGKKSIEDIYQKKTQLEHILIRPDTYIGSVEAIREFMWVWDSSANSMEYRQISFVPGFFKIFDEILVNAADNKIRDSSMDTLRVTIDKENSTISVFNNGRGIPIEIHKEEKVYVPELIFGHLLTSSNYNDNEKKVTGGRNGYGAKLCNIFSNEFIVETADKNSGKKFKQVFKKNMSSKGEPQITSNTRNEEFTKITFKPDLSKFGMECIDSDIESLMQKRVYDLAGTVRGVKVYLNGERVPVKNFRQYVDLYLANKIDENSGKAPLVIHEVLNERWEVAFALSDGQFQQVSFVNSISTFKGGTHVNYIVDQITPKLAEAIGKKNKAATVKHFQIKNHMWIFINCLIENPAFDSQTKETLTLRASSFGSKCTVPDEFITKIKKSGLIESVLSWAQHKQIQELKKTDGHKFSRINGIVKLDDANNAGTRNGSNCTLILTEGDSAKTLAVSGLSVVGRDNFGVFPLRGKLLNVREASHKQIMENQEINHIKQIMGLQHGKKYTETTSLRYGHLMIMTDQDHDGSHIKGLIINFLDFFWPDLLKVSGFLCEFITPIVKVTKGKQEISFFTIPEYEHWKEVNGNGKGWTIKYYKGLGTSTKEDARKYFNQIDNHRKLFHAVEDSERDLIDMAFSKKKADNRKDWLRQYEPGTYMEHDVDEIHITEFINKELILFSMADNARSIPSAVDGLKPGLRKILFACFKRNLTRDEIKVAQLAGYIAEHSAYHHGEQSLQASIVGMAQNFVGSNNVNLLEPRGQFGSRLQGGKDAASPRYIFTKLANLARVIFNKADDAILDYLHDDGQSIEPTWYIPVVPLLLINGGEGIGTGWSCSIPNYNPMDVVDNLRRLMDGDQMNDMHPWYNGFKGIITPQGTDKYMVSGIISKTGPTTLEITELPVRTWTQTYKEYLETLVNGSEKVPSFIKDFKEYHSDTSVHFVITLTEENMEKAEQEGLEKKFKLTTSISTSNMVCFDEEGRIKKYSSPLEILKEFYHLRLKFYQKRKEYLVESLSGDLEKLENKMRFILAIISGKLVVQNRKKSDIIAKLTAEDYREFTSREDSSDGYDYLLSMPLWSLTFERLESLKSECKGKKEELNNLLSKTGKDLWRADLDDFVREWKEFEAMIREQDSGSSMGKGKKLNVKPKKKKLLSLDADIDDEEDEDDEFFISGSQRSKNSTTSVSSKVKKEKPLKKRKEEGLPPTSPSPKKPKKKAPAEKMPSYKKPPVFIDLGGSDEEDEIIIKPAARSVKAKNPSKYVEISEGEDQDEEDDFFHVDDDSSDDDFSQEE